MAIFNAKKVATMFPTLYECFKGMVPEVYFGGREVPAYARIDQPLNFGLAPLIERIRSVGTDCSGYIEEDGAYYHLRERESAINIDLSRPFTFISQPHEVFPNQPTSFGTLRFLQEPVVKALFISKSGVVLVEKSDPTYEICRTLDRLWECPPMQKRLREFISYEELAPTLLPFLMRLYEQQEDDGYSAMWEFWDTFSHHLLVHRLALKLQVLHSC